MENIKKTNRDVIRFLEVATPLLNQCTGESQFKYALTKVIRSARKAFERYDAALVEINVRNASVDDKGNILNNNQGGFVFATDALVKRHQEAGKLMDKEVDVGFYFVTNGKKLPIELNGMQEEALEGFVLPEMKEPKDSEAEAGDKLMAAIREVGDRAAP